MLFGKFVSFCCAFRIIFSEKFFDKRSFIFEVCKAGGEQSQNFDQFCGQLWIFLTLWTVVDFFDLVELLYKYILIVWISE